MKEATEDEILRQSVYIYTKLMKRKGRGRNVDWQKSEPDAPPQSISRLWRAQVKRNTPAYVYIYISINVWNVGICLNKYLKDSKRKPTAFWFRIKHPDTCPVVSFSPRAHDISRSSLARMFREIFFIIRTWPCHSRKIEKRHSKHA